MKLAHLSDPHLPTHGLPPLTLLAGKRGLGYANWLRRRRWIHRGAIADALVQDLKAHQPDHVALTGDLVNIALPREFRDASAWLERLGSPDWISLVPGNHDAYVDIAQHHGLGLWAQYMRGDDAHGAGAGTPLDWPYLRIRGQTALIGVSTAMATPLFMATGEAGEVQHARLAAMLRDCGQKGLCRVVLIHHPPLSGAARMRRRMIDTAQFERIVAQAGCELVLHGHNHKDMLAFTPGPNGPVPVLGVPSASSKGGHGEPPAQYFLLDIARRQSAWHIALTVRGIDPESLGFSTLAHVNLWERAMQPRACSAQIEPI